MLALDIGPLLQTDSLLSTDTLKWLVNNGGDVKVQSSKGRTALDMAKDRGLYDIIRFLKESGESAFPYIRPS